MVEESPTLLFPASANNKEITKLLRQVVDSIAHYTDYQVVTCLILADSNSDLSRMVVCSDNVPEEIRDYLKEHRFTGTHLREVLEGGIGIKIDELGFAAYYPHTHHEFMGDFLHFFKNVDHDYDDTVLLDDGYWNHSDGLITPILSRRGQLYGLILLSCPKTGQSPNAFTILPILAFANQIAQAIESAANDRMLTSINRELCTEKDKLKALFNISCSAQAAETLDDKLHRILQGITDIGWKRVSIYLYDEVLGLEKAVHTESALRGGRVLSDTMTSERRREIFATLSERWNYEHCYYLRYLDSEAQPIIEEFFEGTWLMTSATPKEDTTNRWHPLDLLLIPMRARNGRLIGIIHVADPVDGLRPTTEACNILQLYSHESALIVEQATLDEEKTRLQAEREQHIIELRQSNEKLQELERIRHDFTATLVHDIRSPMTVVVGTFELLMMHSQKSAETRLPAKLATLLDNAQITCKQIVNMINELLDLSKIEHTGDLNLEKKPLDPRELITGVVNECDPLAENKQINVTFGCTDDVRMIMGDRNYLQRALVNLLSNAIKYTPKGGQIWFEARKLEEKFINNGTEYVMFSVIDTGPGIAAEDLPYVFDPYYQASNKKGNLGTGLGLAIVKRIAAAHGGNVKVHSQVGVGSVFSIMIPMLDGTVTPQITID